MNMDVSIIDGDKLHVFTDSDLSSNIFSFSEAPLGTSSSNLVDFSTRVAWSARNPRFLGTTNRVGPGAVAHRPWEDGVPCLPRWLNGQCYDSVVPGCTRRPKTFKPILLYHRPEQSVRHPPRVRRFSGHRGFSMCSAGDGTCCYLENCPGSVEEPRRDLFSSAGSQICGSGVADLTNSDFLSCNCSSGCPLGPAKRSQCTLKAVEGVYPSIGLGKMTGNSERRCRGSCSWSDDSYSVIPHIPLSVASQGPFPGNPQTPLSAMPPLTPFSITPLTANPPQASQTQQTLKPYFPMHMFSRRAVALESGSASEIRRALLFNHPVFNDTCMECCDCSDKHNGLHNNNDNNNKHGDFHTSCDKAGGGFLKNKDKLDAVDFGSHASNKGVRNPTAKLPVSSTFSFSPELEHDTGPPSATFSLQIHTETSNHVPVIPPTVVPQTLPPQTPSLTSAAGGVDHGWQEWAGKYGSFLQLLNDPDYPLSTDAKSAFTLSSLVTEVPVEKRLLDAGREFNGVFNASSTACLRAAFPGVTSERATVGLHRAAPLGGLADDGEERGENRKHKCPYCDVACTNNGQLKGHLRVHTGQYFVDC